MLQNQRWSSCSKMTKMFLVGLNLFSLWLIVSEQFSLKGTNLTLPPKIATFPSLEWNTGNSLNLIFKSRWLFEPVAKKIFCTLLTMAYLCKPALYFYSQKPTVVYAGLVSISRLASCHQQHSHYDTINHGSKQPLLPLKVAIKMSVDTKNYEDK